MNIIENLKDPVKLGATVANLFGLIEVFGITNFCGVDENTVLQALTVVISIIVQCGIYKNKKAIETENH